MRLVGPGMPSDNGTTIGDVTEVGGAVGIAILEAARRARALGGRATRLDADLASSDHVADGLTALPIAIIMLLLVHLDSHIVLRRRQLRWRPDVDLITAHSVFQI